MQALNISQAGYLGWSCISCHSRMTPFASSKLTQSIYITWQ